jgi:uncharacterized protein RhaS with RHS repeats
MQARYYDPVIGRFYSNDPVGYTAKNPVMSFNRYLYVNNNPYKYIDPNGGYFQVVSEDDQAKFLEWIHKNSSSKYEFDSSGFLSKVPGSGGDGKSSTFTDALDEIIGYADKGVTGIVNNISFGGESIDGKYHGGATSPSGDTVYLSGNSARLNGRSGPRNRPGKIDVAPNEIFAHEIVDHASPYLKGLEGTRYQGINSVLTELKINKKVGNNNDHVD